MKSFFFLNLQNISEILIGPYFIVKSLIIKLSRIKNVLKISFQFVEGITELQ